MKARAVAGLACLALSSGAFGSAHAQVQGFRSERLRTPASVDDGLVLQLPEVLPHLHVSAGVTIGYASDSLISGGARGDFALVDQRFGGSASLALGLEDRFEIGAILPATLSQNGDDPSSLGLDAPAAAGLGELEFNGSVLAIESGGLRLGGAVGFGLPTGSDAALLSDGGVSGEGRVLFSYDFKVLTLAADSGLRFRPDRQYRAFLARDTWVFRAGVHVPLADRRLRAMLEADGETGLASDSFFRQLTTPVELLLGGRYVFDNGLQLGPAFGVGLNGAPTTPRWRLLATLGWSGGRRAASFEPESQDTIDARDRCAVDPAECAPADDDHDGVPNGADRCPAAAEDRDGFADDDGCADLDNDGDSVPDDRDGCRDAPEVVNGFEDHDGCPDELPPLQAAVPTPEVASPEEIPLPAPILFGRGGAKLPSGSEGRLRSVVELMKAHPELRIEVSGHSSADGTPARNEALAAQRAATVVSWLTQHGVAADRLRAVSRGVAEPRGDDATEAGRLQNRRVEFRRWEAEAEGGAR